MLSTMQDVPLLASRILTHGRTVHGRSTITTWTEDGPRRRSFAEIGDRAAQLANALRDELSVGPSDVVATLINARLVRRRRSSRTPTRSCPPGCPTRAADNHCGSSPAPGCPPIRRATQAPASAPINAS